MFRLLHLHLMNLIVSSFEHFLLSCLFFVAFFFFFFFSLFYPTDFFFITSHFFVSSPLLLFVFFLFILLISALRCRIFSALPLLPIFQSFYFYILSFLFLCCLSIKCFKVSYFFSPSPSPYISIFLLLYSLFSLSLLFVYKVIRDVVFFSPSPLFLYFNLSFYFYILSFLFLCCLSIKCFEMSYFSALPPLPIFQSFFLLLYSLSSLFLSIPIVSLSDFFLSRCIT
ncbi:unnamed protein product [Acanthosepion pharaonis]|uniref:Uncharacterized protein n=1 Tax=Acanthosepion pharaonis TaxID=158019 RepID=A0A812ED48_ACAPH|nr:unnamed protein product [Sepia pharaonis]